MYLQPRSHRVSIRNVSIVTGLLLGGSAFGLKLGSAGVRPQSSEAAYNPPDRAQYRWVGYCRMQPTNISKQQN